MDPIAARWLDGLREFVDRYRADRPVVAATTPEHRGQRPILSTHLSTWIDGEAASLPASHAIVLTTSDLGIAVADEAFAGNEPLIASLRQRMLAVREIEYRLWIKDNSDPERAWHVNHWSWVKAPVPPQRHGEFQAWPLQPGEAYWLHRVGTSGPGIAESRHAHLWKWTGSHAVLLRPFIRERVESL